MIFPLDSRRERAAPSLVSSPQFRLDLGHGVPPALSFATAQKALSAPPKKEQSVSISARLARLIFATQCLIVFVLIVMIGGLMYWSLRLNSNVRYYYTIAEPYMSEARDRGMSIIKHADESSASMEKTMEGAATLAQRTGPMVLDSLNRTARMVERLESVARNPTLKLSLA